MPRFYAEDYFQQEIDRVKHIINTLTLKAPFIASYKVALEDEPYRRPWNALRAVEEGQEIITTPTLKLAPCPGSVLQCEEVTQGLFVEHFTHNDCLLIEPPLLKHPSTPHALRAISHSPVTLPVVLDKVCHLGRETSGELIKDHEAVAQQETVCNNISLQLDHPICYYPPSSAVDATPSSLYHYQSKQLHEAPPSDPYRKPDTDQRLEQLILAKIPNPVSLHVLLASHHPTQVPHSQTAIARSRHCEPTATLHHHLLDKPKIDPDNISDNISELEHFQSEGVLTEELVERLVWNPFSIIAANVEITTSAVSQQFVCEAVQEVRARREQFSWTQDELPSVGKPTKSPGRTKRPQLSSMTHVAKPPTPSKSTVLSAKQVKHHKLNQALHILEPARASNSVEAFMALRKKVTVPVPQELVPVIAPVAKAKMVNEIEVAADGPTTKIVHCLTLYCLPYIEQLVHMQVLAETKTFTQLDVTNIEFLLKEHQTDPEVCNILKLLIPLKQAIITALQVSSDLAITSLSNADITDERFELCKRDVKQLQSEVTVSGHSTAKLTQLCKIIEQAKGLVLVLVAGEMGVKTVVAELLLKVLPCKVGQHVGVSGCKALVIHRNEIGTAFAWNIFSTVVEFNSPAPCLGLTLSEYEVEHYILTTTLTNMLPDNTLSGLKLIAFSSLDTRILQQLEAVYGFELFQRQSQGPFSTESVIVDERRCIVIVTSLNDIKLVKSLSSLFIRLSAKYTDCSVIIDISTCHVPQLYSLLFASISHFEKFNISLYYCLTVESVCERVVSIVQHAQRNIAPGWSSTELWTKRTWLCEDVSNHERLLTTFPCLNSYCAQIMLTTYTLVELCQLTLQEALQTLIVLPAPFITQFHHLLNNTTNRPHTKPERKVNFNFTHSQSLRFSPQDHQTPDYYTTHDMLPKAPRKPQHIVRPMFVQAPNDAKGKRQIIEDNKHSFSFSKKRKVLITKDRISLDGQTKLFIGQ